MFEQFESEINNILTSGVRNVAGAAEEIMNSAVTIKSQEDKIKSLTKTKKSLKKKITELEEELAKSQKLVKKYKKKLASYKKDSESLDSSSVEVVEDTQEELLVLSRHSSDMSNLDSNNPETLVSQEHIESELENDRDDKSTISSVDEEVSVLEAPNDGGFEAVLLREEKEVNSELDIVWNKMTREIEHSSKLREQIEAMKHQHRDETLSLKTQNSTMTIELEDYRLKCIELETQIKYLDSGHMDLKLENKTLEANSSFWKRNFFLQLIFIFGYFYLSGYSSSWDVNESSTS